MKCPCCGAETPDLKINEALWNYDFFITWFKNHISYSSYKKYDIEHYHGRVKLKHSELKNYKEILSKVILFIDCDINSGGKFPVKYAAVEKKDIAQIAMDFVGENQVWIKGLKKTDIYELTAIIRATFRDLVHWNHPNFEFHVERALKQYKLAN